jgi:hypothetical protein
MTERTERDRHPERNQAAEGHEGMPKEGSA